MAQFHFVPGEQYTRRDLRRCFGMPERGKGGDIDTGYFRLRGAFFILCGIGTAGRTGHNYHNGLRGNRLIWSGKTNTVHSQPFITAMTSPGAEVHIFTRAEDRAPFTYRGLGQVQRIRRTTPVRVTWRIRRRLPSVDASSGGGPASVVSSDKNIGRRYWIMKGNPRNYDWWRELRVGKVEDWNSARMPPEVGSDDRIFFWESTPHCRVVALGVVVKPRYRTSKHRDWVCDVRYLTERLPWMPGITLLRHRPLLRTASFLKPGAYNTVFALTRSQAGDIYRIVIGRNPNHNVWPDLCGLAPIPDIDLGLSAKEGDPRLVSHIRRERNRALVKKKKAAFVHKHGKLSCESCGSDYAWYGHSVDGPFEVHHRRLLSKSVKTVKTKLDDLAVLCSNCHRVIHRFNPMISVEQLATRIRDARAQQS